MARSTLARTRFQRTSAEGGGGGNPPDNGGEQPTGGGEQPKPEAVDEAGVPLGFPKETEVKDMTPVQQAAYWRNQAKVQQKKIPGNLDELINKAKQFDTLQNQQLPPAEQAVTAARDEGISLGRRQAAEDSAMTTLRVVLAGRGKTSEETDELLDLVDPKKFLTADGALDAAKVNGYANRVAPLAAGSGGTPGQGRGHDTSKLDPRDLGRQEAARRGWNKETDKPPVFGRR